jgi:N-acetylglucosaminyldiphosphoundecaprenol N-acetyl-beta-D-mannosaminyltransferase
VGTDAAIVRPDQPDAPEQKAILERIRAARPDLLMVALGAPKQEIWIGQNAGQLGNAVALGVGASVDFIAGRVPRAPRWMSKAGLEWCYRLAREPRRLWRRYLVNDPKFLVILARDWRTRRNQSR